MFGLSKAEQKRKEFKRRGYFDYMAGDTIGERASRKMAFGWPLTPEEREWWENKVADNIRKRTAGENREMR